MSDSGCFGYLALLAIVGLGSYIVGEMIGHTKGYKDAAPLYAFEVDVNPFPDGLSDRDDWGSDFVVTDKFGKKYLFLRQNDKSLKKLEDVTEEINNKAHREMGDKE